VEIQHNRGGMHAHLPHGRVFEATASSALDVPRKVVHCASAASSKKSPFRVNFGNLDLQWVQNFGHFVLFWVLKNPNKT
jgi:hypothetical protein